MDHAVDVWGSEPDTVVLCDTWRGHMKDFWSTRVWWEAL